MPNSKSVLFLESSPNIGGQELQLLQQMRELKNDGFHVRLLCKFNSRIKEFAKERGLEYSEVRFRNALDFRSILAVRRQILELRPLAIILHSGHDSIVGAIAARSVKNRPKIVRMRTYMAGPPKTIPYQYLFDITLTCSEFLREVILSNKNISKDKVKVLYPGIDFEEIKKSQRCAHLPPNLKNWLDSHPGPVILHGAMLRPEKGHKVILAALPEILNKHPNLRYIIAGDGKLRADLEQLSKSNNLENNVFFAGLITPIHPLFQIADIAIMPSAYEPLGMFQIESIFSSTPTIASDTGGIPETVKHRETGLLADPKNPADWAGEILWALDNLDQMKYWALEGARQNEARFDIKNNTESLKRHIEQATTSCK